MPVVTPTVDMSWHHGMACKTFSIVEHDYRRYRVVADGNEGRLAEVTADVVNDPDYISAQEAL